ncbi:hypothetical protein ADUPG1_000799, partial [Aduncisulcus paluster]
IAAISEGFVCSETAPSSDTWNVTCMSDSYYTYFDSDTFTCTRSADCSGGCEYGSECRVNSDGTHGCASVVPDVGLHGCVSGLIDAADKVSVGDGTYAFGVSSLKSIPASSSLTCSSSSVSSLVGLEHVGTLSTVDLSSNSIVDISPLSTLTELITLNLSSNGIIDISSISTVPSLTSIDVHSNQISDVSVLINENETTLLPTGVLEYLDISDNLICDIADVNTILSSYFTNSSFSLVSTESEQTCMCSPVPDFSNYEICSETSSDTWESECWDGYLTFDSSERCTQFKTFMPDANLRNDICLVLDHAAHCDDLTPGDLQHLTSLNTYFVDSFAGLSAATNLTTLYVSNTDSVSKQLSTSDIDDLPTSLETLTLNNIDIAPNTDFSRLTSLRALYLTVGAVSSGDYWATQLSSLSPLFDSDNHYDVTVQGMFPSSLTTLSISGRTNVTFPGFFSSLALSDGSALPALTTLDLSGTSVYDLSPVPATVTSLDLAGFILDDISEKYLLYLGI